MVPTKTTKIGIQRTQMNS